MNPDNPDPIVVAVALSLYHYNVSPLARAKRLNDHFGGQCMEIVDLVDCLHRPSAVTDMPIPTSLVYVQHALERYQQEAEDRVRANLQPLEYERNL